MTQHGNSAVLRHALTVITAFVAAAPASANDFDLLSRIPEAANAVVLIHVEELLRSPLALREKWRDKQGPTERPIVTMAPDTESILLASKVNLVGSFDNAWDVALVETNHEVSIPLVARAEGGYVDTVEGLPVAFSPRDAFMVALTPRILGVMFPANRQDLARWLRARKERKTPEISPYLREAVGKSQGGPPFLMAMDLEDLLTLPQVRARLRTSESLRTKDVNREAVAKVLASLKGVTFTVLVDNNLNGKLRLDFGEPTTALSLIAKPLLFEALEGQGLMLDDLKDWRILVAGHTIALEGRLSVDGLRTISSLIPLPAETLPTSSNGGPLAEKGGSLAEKGRPIADSPGTASSKPEASRRYYKQLTARINELEAKSKDHQNTEKIYRIWTDRLASEIDRLPILNVDDDLVAFGAWLSQTLRELRNDSYGSGLNASYRQTNSNYGRSFYAADDLTLTTSLINRQEKIGLEVVRTKAWTDIQNKTAEIRRKMTQKYQVEF